MEDRKWIFIYLLIISSFVSISLFEIMVVLGLIWVVYDFIKNKNLEGKLKIPVLTFSSVALVSTSLFGSKMLLKAVEEGFFQTLYFFRVNQNKDKILKIIYLFVLIGVLLLPVIAFRFYTEGQTRAVWGSTFEVGQFYAEFSIFLFLIGVVLWKSRNFRYLTFVVILAVVFLVVLFLTHRRSPILGFLVVSFLTLFVLYKNHQIHRRLFAFIVGFIIVSAFAGYAYLSLNDVRFQLLNQVITGKAELSYQILNRISSARVAIGTDAVNIIKSDIENGNYINLLIGHGIRSGYYLPHTLSPQSWYKYESFFLLSEFIEVGLIGVTAQLWIIFVAFKTFLSVKIRESEDIIAIGLFVPLLIHIIGAFFTFFWDALLPMYLLLFKIGEVYFKNKK